MLPPFLPGMLLTVSIYAYLYIYIKVYKYIYIYITNTTPGSTVHLKSEGAGVAGEPKPQLVSA